MKEGPKFTNLSLRKTDRGSDVKGNHKMKENNKIKQKNNVFKKKKKRRSLITTFEK